MNNLPVNRMVPAVFVDVIVYQGTGDREQGSGVRGQENVFVGVLLIDSTVCYIINREGFL